LGINRIYTPSMYHYRVLLDEAVSLGDLRHAESPEEPIILSLARYPAAPGLPKKEQLIEGRRELLNTSFEFYERSIRDQLGRVLSGGGFDPGRDIFGIAVNRWPHGYSYTYNTLDEPWDWVFTSSDERPCVVGRQPYGQITIANADAAASPHTDASILEAHRAIEEVMSFI
jgi:spermidine dehydrogenase